MNDVAGNLIDELCRVLPEHVRSRLEGLGVPNDRVGLDQAQKWLRTELERLLDAPFERQTRGPLEIFQEAMKFPTAQLEALGVVAPERDPATIEALPGDRYGLAPASSSELGEDAWEAHIRWGAAKAAALSRPLIVVLSNNMLDVSRIEPVAAAAGLRSWTVRSLDALTGAGQPSWALVDLTLDWVVEGMKELAAGGVQFVAYGPHVDEESFVTAKVEGARDAVPRSRFFKAIEEFLPKVA